MISSYFIDRPVFASVLSIIITLAGLFALKALPIEQYPNITPPQIQVSATYPGADATTVASSVAAPLEQQINGVDNMIYMYSQNASTGDMVLSVFFDIGTDINMAQVNVQNRVSIAMPQLPLQVQYQGIVLKKQTPTILLLVSVESPDDRYDNIYISNYAQINLVNEISRLPGVSNAVIINARNYAMRIWIRPDRLAQLKLTAEDVVNAIKEQNRDFTAGMLGTPPMASPVPLTLPITGLGRLDEPQEYEDIILRANTDGSFVRIKDIGYVELGAQSYDVNGKLDGKESLLIAIYQEFGANALDVGESVKKTMERAAASFPPGLTYRIPYDTTDFIIQSITEVVKTIFEAAVLVSLVVLIFLQNWRATLVPVIAMIVSIIGTFAGMHVVGFSLNTLTLFGLVLAIGIVVDDAIVVIENVERNMRDFGMSPREASHKAMEEVSGPVVAIVFVLCAVFIPVAFLGGIAGQLYKQFAITISVSVVISGIVALTLSPALAAILLKPHTKPGRLAEWFNRNFDRFTNGYIKGTKWILSHAWFGLLLFAGVIAVLVFLAMRIPTSFIPNEDQGYLIAVNNMPDASSLDRTDAVDQKITEIALKEPGVRDVTSLTGFSLLESLNRIQIGTNFITLQDWSKREAPDLQASAIAMKLNKKYSQIADSQIFVFNPPAIQGLGTVGGFEFWIESRGDATMQEIEQVTRDLIKKASERPELTNLTTALQSNNLELFIDLDRSKARALNVQIGDILQTLQIFFGSIYVNLFNKFGQVYQVTVQSEPAYRAFINNLGDMYVRSSKGDMVPLRGLIQTKYSRGPSLVSRFNGYWAAKIIGSTAPGYSSGQGMAAMAEVAKENLPDQMTFAWSGQAYQEQALGGTSFGILFIGVLMVFLILAALYERWSLPFAVILAVPFGLMGAFVAIWLRGISNDVYFDVGLVTLIALAAKNAILIVEFAIIKREEGKGVHDSAIEAAGLRFRAILMTSLTFILGVVPLLISKGAGAASRHSVGTGVFGGMIAATALAVFLVPLFYKLIDQVVEKRDRKKRPPKNDNINLDDNHPSLPNGGS
ncbi:MAG: multidrug efflux RND transporter permease subunit [Parachlamydiaceae bacterium]|nr:multidrug efflux RND transporter permease subunit [Parachlamydiaceae bacterium]